MSSGFAGAVTLGTEDQVRQAYNNVPVPHHVLLSLWSHSLPECVWLTATSVSRPGARARGPLSSVSHPLMVSHVERDSSSFLLAGTSYSRLQQQIDVASGPHLSTRPDGLALHSRSSTMN